MPVKSVAVESDITATAGQKAPEPAVSGKWSKPETLTVSTYDKLSIDGKPAVYAAQGTFTFTGSDSNGVKVDAVDPLSLKASDLGGTRLQGGKDHVLRDGDSTDATPSRSLYGNVISVNASGRLRSD